MHAAFYGKHGPPIGCREEFRRRYLAEIEAQRPRIEESAARVRAGETVTLLCASACTDPAYCHRTLLKALIDDAVAR